MRIKKCYKNMQDLERDLMLLELQSNICKEEIRLASKSTQASFNPTEITKTFVFDYVRKSLSNMAIDFGLGLIRAWRYRKY